MRFQTIAQTALLLLAAAAPCAAHAQIRRSLTLGANSRGYVSANQVFTSACTVGSFGQPGAPPSTFAPGNATIDCAGAGWAGRSVMQSTGRTLRSYTSVAVTDPNGVTLAGQPNGSSRTDLVALSRAIFLDQMTISSQGVVPDSARFTFYLTGGVHDVPGANATTSPTANFSIGWNSINAPGVFQGIVMAPGLYRFAFAITPSMVDQPIYFSIALQTFATLTQVDPTQPMFGSAISDYSHTLKVLRLQYVQASAQGGAGVDVTGQVQASFGTDANYTAAIAAPEPATTGLVSVGLLALGTFVRRRRRTLA